MMKNKVEFRVVIPARYASTRLPGKMLCRLHGRPMIEYVRDIALASGASQVIVATDDERIAKTVRNCDGDVCMTSTHHQSGTDRLNEVAGLMNWRDDEIVVNLQGDEPLMPPALVEQVARELSGHPEVEISTVAGHFESVQDWRDPNVVKVVRDAANLAMYFSRAPIPWDRDGFARGALRDVPAQALRHVGLYAYRVDALRRFSTLTVTDIETVEALEQLRALHHGMRIYVGIANPQPGPGVDTAEDLQRVERLLQPG